MEGLMAKKPVSVSLEENLLERIDEKRGELSRSAWIESEILKGLSGRPEPVIVGSVQEHQEGRKLDPYPAAPSDPQARRDWTGNRAAGWSAFGVPNYVQNAELIAQQRKVHER